MEYKSVIFRNIKIFVNDNDTVGKIILKGKEEAEQLELDTLLKNVNTNSIIVDVGACYGEYTLVCASKATNGIVIAIEPNPYHFELLKKGVEANNLKNVILINKALTNKEGKSDFYMGDKHLEGSTLFKDKMIQEIGNQSYKKIEIKTITLDKLLADLKISHIDILKIDSEGAEVKILKGAMRTLINCNKLKMLTEFGCIAISSSREIPIEYLKFLIGRFKDVTIVGGETGEDENRIINKNNIESKCKIVCTNIWCE